MLRRVLIYCLLPLLLSCGELEEHSYYCDTGGEGIFLKGDYSQQYSSMSLPFVGYLIPGVVVLQNTTNYDLIVRQTRQLYRNNKLIDVFAVSSLSNKQIDFTAGDIFEISNQQLLPIVVIHANLIKKSPK